jgi:K+-transporting ATPase ATPase B chain
MLDSVRKLDPRTQVKNPVMFIVEVGSLLTSIIFVQELTGGTGHPFFTGQVAAWLWFTVIFANFAEAMAEGRGKAQADTLRRLERRRWRIGSGRTARSRSVPQPACARAIVVMVKAASSSR